MIKFTSVQKSFTTPSWILEILKDCTFEIPTWTFASIMWPSWSWKTTALNLLSWLEDATWWTISIDDHNLTSMTYDQRTQRRWKHVGFVFQQFYLLPELTVSENIDLVIDMNQLERRFETNEILEKVWLTGKENSYPEQLSWWEQQRVALARAFVWKTPYLLADEPTWNLDQNTAKEVMNLMITMHKEIWNTIVMITHDKDIADYASLHFTFANKTLVTHG